MTNPAWIRHKMIFWDGHIVTKPLFGMCIRHKINCWKGDSSQNQLLEGWFVTKSIVGTGIRHKIYCWGFVTKSIVGDSSQNLFLKRWRFVTKSRFGIMGIRHKIKIWNNGESLQNQNLGFGAKSRFAVGVRHKIKIWNWDSPHNE